MLNLRESYHQPMAVTTTQGTEIYEWNSRLPGPHIGRGLDSMGLPKISSKRLVARKSRPFTDLFIVITSVANDA